MWEKKIITFDKEFIYEHQFQNELNKYPEWQLVQMIPAFATMNFGTINYMAVLQREVKEGVVPFVDMEKEMPSMFKSKERSKK